MENPQERRYTAGLLANELHGYYEARGVDIPKSWKTLWTTDMMDALLRHSQEEIKQAMEAADYPSQQKFNVTCRGFVTNIPLLLDKYRAANKTKAKAASGYEYQQGAKFFDEAKEL